MTTSNAYISRDNNIGINEVINNRGHNPVLKVTVNYICLIKTLLLTL